MYLNRLDLNHVFTKANRPQHIVNVKVICVVPLLVLITALQELLYNWNHTTINMEPFQYTTISWIT